jgi:Holliday junction DNA helicase RuvA
MFAYIRGKIRDKSLANTNCVVEVNGIGYLIQTNLKTLNQLKLDDERLVYTWLSSNEDGMRLLGFLTKAEKELFELLISVSGVGPKAALKILDTFSVDQFISAVLREETKLISSAPGVGAKTAARIILELQNKLKKISSPVISDNKFSAAEEASSVLSGLGFSALEIDEKLQLAEKNNVADDIEELVRFCIKA